MSDPKSWSREEQAGELQKTDAQEINRILASKYWTFDAIQRGDCRIEPGARFVLYSDGSTHWICDISSGDTGDEWRGFFRITNSSGVVLFDTGRYHFDIKEKDVKKRWDEHRGANPDFAKHFNEAQGIGFHCSC